MLKLQDLLVTSLGECQYASPLNFTSASHPEASYFVTDGDRVRLDVMLRPVSQDADPASVEIAGPRQRSFFPPDQTAAIVTCGGSSPGLNNVIRSVLYKLFENYGVPRVLGSRNGDLGLNPASGLEPIALTKEFVEPIVKLMGRHAGLIAAGASVVRQEVDVTLVPEIPFPLEGEQGFLTALERRMQHAGHAVIVVAEGAGQHLFQDESQHRDASGNPRHQDIGAFLRDKISDYFKQRPLPIALKYLDPSYYIRSLPASDHMVHAPISTVVAQTKWMEVAGDLWRAVLQSNAQPGW